MLLAMYSIIEYRSSFECSDTSSCCSCYWNNNSLRLQLVDYLANSVGDPCHGDGRETER